MKKNKITKTQIQAEVIRVTGIVDKKNKDFKVGCILLASAILGANERRIAKFLSYSLQFVKNIGENLRENKIWQGRKVYANWFDKKNGGIAFNCDVAVGLGFLKRKN